MLLRQHADARDATAIMPHNIPQDLGASLLATWLGDLRTPTNWTAQAVPRFYIHDDAALNFGVELFVDLESYELQSPAESTRHKLQATSRKEHVTSYKARAASYKSRATRYNSHLTSHESRVTSHKPRVTSHESRVTSCTWTATRRKSRSRTDRSPLAVARNL